MTASYNISFLGSPEQAESRASKKGYRSSKYNNAGEREQSSSLELPSVSIKGEANNYMVEVVDFDNESHTFEVDARSEASPAHRKKSRAMTREVKKAVTRIRRVQDAVYNNKLGICHSMSIHTNTLVRCDGEVMTWWTVFAHQGEPPAKACRSWTF